MTDEELARKAADDIFGMFGGILHRMIDRIENGFVDGLAEEVDSVKLADVEEPILHALRQSEQHEQGRKPKLI